MTKDIAPDLMEKITSDFQENMKNSSEIQKLAKKISKKTATYREAQKYAIKTSEIMSDALLSNISADMLPDGKLYYNIAQRILQEALGESGTYGYIGTYCDEVQRILNEAANVGIRPVTPKLNQDRINGIVDIVSGKDNFDEIKYMLAEPIVNYGQAIVDEAVRCNADFQFKSGLSPKIIRISTGNCCEWCDRLAGTYDYETIKTGSDVWKRHKHCRCLVEYHPGNGKRQNVHTKRWKDEAAIEKRKEFSFKDGHNENESTSKGYDDVTREYFKSARPRQGIVAYDDGYKRSNHLDEIRVAEWLHSNLGGNIMLLTEKKDRSTKTPDYFWRDAYWELKNTTTEKAADTALRSALKQIKDNPGGIILDYGTNSFDPKNLRDVIGRRIKRSSKFDVDVLIISNDKLFKVYRYKK